eukprot:SAG31_NODE_3713_length_3957_cov_3.801452_5_plen_96_part_01
MLSFVSICFAVPRLLGCFSKTDNSIANVVMPPIERRRCEVEDYGAVANDDRSDAAAIYAALEACGGTLGGEIVLRGPGVYDALPMNLSSNQVLYVA